MIYITGDTHCDFKRFYKKHRLKLPFRFTDSDYMIICGDFGLLWTRDKESEFLMNWLSSLPFRILWVQGNHENYDMIDEYEIEMWKGGKVRHIVRDRIILLERGQVFQIDGFRFFTFGGAASHDIQGGILELSDPYYQQKRRHANKRHLPYRVKGISWWSNELPSAEEMMEGYRNLEKNDYKVDYVITHCCATGLQHILEQWKEDKDSSHPYPPDILTDYFEELENKLEYKHWFCGHYHMNVEPDEKHTVLYEDIVPLTDYCTIR